MFKQNVVLTALYATLAFPLFYFVYKYNTPYLGMIDFFEYFKLYSKLDYASADSPLNMRLVSSFIVFCMSKTGFVYDTASNMDNTPFDKVVYFNAVFFNYICVVFTSVAIFRLAQNSGYNKLLSFLGGVLFLLGFGTIFFELTPLTDALAVLLFAIILIYYNKKSYWLVIPIILLILQREYVLMAVGLIGLTDYIKYKHKFYMHTLIFCLIGFAIYVVLRKLIFETPRYAHHTSSDFILSSLTHLNFPLIPFIRQTLMTMNIFIIYLFIVAFKYYKNLPFNRYSLLKNLLLLAQILILTFLLALGNNAGRYFYILVPLIILSILEELREFKFETERD